MDQLPSALERLVEDNQDNEFAPAFSTEQLRTFFSNLYYIFFQATLRLRMEGFLPHESSEDELCMLIERNIAHWKLPTYRQWVARVGRMNSANLDEAVDKLATALRAEQLLKYQFLFGCHV